MIGLRASAFSLKKQRARVPSGTRIYAIGDIHGRVDLLDQLLERVDVDLSKKPIAVNIGIFLGDYIDRGPQSRQVVDRLVARSRTHRTIFLKGNHETFLTGFITDPAILGDWQRLGGLETLISYGLAPSINADANAQRVLASRLAQALPESHHRFFENLKLCFTCGDYYFVHAGVRPGIPLLQQREEDLLWIRNDFLACDKMFEKIIVHGHTPVRTVEIRPNRINIDTGAYATGYLTCLVLEEDDVRVL